MYYNDKFKVMRIMELFEIWRTEHWIVERLDLAGLWIVWIFETIEQFEQRMHSYTKYYICDAFGCEKYVLWNILNSGTFEL